MRTPKLVGKRAKILHKKCAQDHFEENLWLLSFIIQAKEWYEVEMNGDQDQCIFFFIKKI